MFFTFCNINNTITGIIQVIKKIVFVDNYNNKPQLHKHQLQRMSQRIIYKSPNPPSKLSRGKSPLQPSPHKKIKEQHFNRRQEYSVTPPKVSHVFDNQNHSETNSRFGQQHPLQFSGNRKLKPKQSPLNYQQGLSQNAGHSSAAVYGFTAQNTDNIKHGSDTNNNHLAANGTLYSKNQPFVQEIQKLKNHYESELRIFVDGQRVEFEAKIRNLQKQKNFWREGYVKVKDQYQQYMQSINLKDKQRDLKGPQKVEEYGFTLNKYQGASSARGNHQNATMNQTIIQIQQQLENSTKSLKLAQDQIFGLNKQKTELTSQINSLKEENIKTKNKIFELQYEIQMKSKEVNAFRQKQNKNSSINLLSSIQTKNDNCLKSLTSSINLKQSYRFGKQNSVSPQRSHSGSKIQSGSPSLSNSFSTPTKQKSSSRGHRNSSHNSGSSTQRHAGQTPFDLSVHQNFDQTKQIERFRHTCRKLQKTLNNQNQQVLKDGLRKLNQKYRCYEEQYDSIHFQSNLRDRIYSAESRIHDETVFSFQGGSQMKQIPRYLYDSKFLRS